MSDFYLTTYYSPLSVIMLTGHARAIILHPCGLIQGLLDSIAYIKWNIENLLDIPNNVH